MERGQRIKQPVTDGDINYIHDKLILYRRLTTFEAFRDAEYVESHCDRREFHFYQLWLAPEYAVLQYSDAAAIHGDATQWRGATADAESTS